MDVGFIGLGSMGRGMATSLIKAGHSVRVWNRSRGPVDQLVGKGARSVAAPRGAFTGDAVISMLADDDALRSVLAGGQILNGAPRGIVFVNMATVSLVLARESAALFRSRGVAYIAAPVFGRPMPQAPASCTSSSPAIRSPWLACSLCSPPSARRPGRSAAILTGPTS